MSLVTPQIVEWARQYGGGGHARWIESGPDGGRKSDRLLVAVNRPTEESGGVLDRPITQVNGGTPYLRSEAQDEDGSAPVASQVHDTDRSLVHRYLMEPLTETASRARRPHGFFRHNRSCVTQKVRDSHKNSFASGPNLAAYAGSVPVWFLRHGQSVANAEGIFAGQGIDSPLTPAGRDQVRCATAHVPSELAWIVSSPPLEPSRQLRLSAAFWTYLAESRSTVVPLRSTWAKQPARRPDQ